jgi:hypothetical protein
MSQHFLLLAVVNMLPIGGSVVVVVRWLCNILVIFL